MAGFIPGLQLSKRFYKDAVQPILARHWPRLGHSAALMGSGSEVLGFDSAMSTDHGWGPRVLLFLGDGDHRKLAGSIGATMARELPRVFLGYRTHFFCAPGADSCCLGDPGKGPINHRVEILTVRSFFHGRYGIDPDRPLTVCQWLTATEQALLELTRGMVFHDGLGCLAKLRRRLRYYPRDIWLYLLACQWTRIAQEEAFIGRTGIVADGVGSGIVAARLVSDVMRLCFLMEKQYAPYSKWFGTAYSRLRCARRFTPCLQEALSSRIWRRREQAVVKACELAAQMHNAMRITTPLTPQGRRFHDRPFRVIGAERFTKAILQKIRNVAVRKLQLVGSVDQFSATTDLLDSPRLCRKLQLLYN